MPNFDIFFKGCYDDVEVFRPFNGWDELCEEEPEDNEEQAMIRKLIATRNDNRKLFLELADELHGMKFEGVDMLWHPVGRIQIDVYEGMKRIQGETIEHEFEAPGLEESLFIEEYVLNAITNYIRGEFCVVKVWQNTGGCIYRCKSPASDKQEFDINKLIYDGGQITYDGEGFEFIHGDGMSSYTMIFVDGKQVDEG